MQSSFSDRRVVTVVPVPGLALAPAPTPASFPIVRGEQTTGAGVAIVWGPLVQGTTLPTVVGRFVGVHLSPDLALALTCSDTRWAHRILRVSLGEPCVLASVPEERVVVGFSAKVNGRSYLFDSFRVVHLPTSTSRHLTTEELRWLVNYGLLTVENSRFAQYLLRDLPRETRTRTRQTRGLQMRRSESGLFRFGVFQRGHES